MVGYLTTCLALLYSVGQITCQNFDSTVVGVAFSPYVDQLPGRGWDAYTVSDIQQMLGTISNSFQRISTYSAGVDASNQNNNWDQTFSNCNVGKAAAALNNNQGTLAITVNQGIYQFSDQGLQQKEISNAFSIAQNANAAYPGTVWGLTFTNEFIQNTDQGGQVLAMLQANKAQANSQGLLVGTRINTCWQILGGDLQGILIQIAQNSDFIYCNMYPGTGVTDPNQAAQDIGGAFLQYQTAFQNANPNILVQIGETGWPSEGDSFNQTPNNVQNLVAFWNAMGQWASNNGVMVQMFEAIDEPWKTAIMSGEGHYGWWYSNNNGQYIQKA